MGAFANPKIKTDCLGDIDTPTVEELQKMHWSQYILHACNGKLTSISVEKNWLPRDPVVNPQGVCVALGRDDTVYVILPTMICKSSDGGRTWNSYQCTDTNGAFEILNDGTFIRLFGGDINQPVIVQSSSDEGRTWKEISQIELPKDHSGGVHWVLCCPDNVLVCAVAVADHVFESVDNELKLLSGKGSLRTYRSIDGGKSWHNPADITDWGSEGGVTLTASGKLLAVVRYQRPILPEDPPGLEKRTGSISAGWPYKHVFLTDSTDQGLTWKNFRQLTTVFGQTRSYPASLNNGIIVVIHDTRYGPGSPGSRAMVSYDDGITWSNEVYYMDYTTFTGSYNESVVLNDGTILTVAASSQAGNSWEAVAGNTDLIAIRWKPVNTIDLQG